MTLKKTFNPQTLISICKWLHQRNLLAAADGNVSIRVSAEEIWITPSGLHKGFLVPEDLACITLDNKIVKGNPSSERLMHLEVYNRCPEAQAVVHAHPPTAIAWSVARPELKELPSNSLSEIILAVGKIPIVPYSLPGTSEMAQSLLPFLSHHRVMILARHGGLSWGEDLMEAYGGMERLEHTAQILKASHELGGLTALPEKEIQRLRNLRQQLGPKTR